jgi:hypothetical protein
MRIEHWKGAPRGRHLLAYSIPELLIAVLVVELMAISMYTGFSSGFAVVQLARENLRATQILQEKMETVRLYTWDQITTAGFIPDTFTDVFYAGTNSPHGLTYTGTVSIASAPLSAESYAGDLRMVSVEVRWKSANVLRKREMTTLVSRYGLQNYIY